MEESVETLEHRPGFWQRTAKAIGRAINSFSLPEAKIQTDSPQLWHVYWTIKEGSGLNLQERNFFEEAYRLFEKKLEEKSKVKDSKFEGWVWDLKSTPDEFQDEEYSLLTLFLLDRFLLDAKNKKEKELETSILAFGDPKISYESVKEVLQEKRERLQEQFCQKNKWGPEIEPAKKHFRFIQSQANSLSLAIGGAAHPNEVHLAIIQTFQSIQKNRNELLVPSAV